MGRRATIFWHTALSAAGGVLYYFFVLPRWPELMGDITHGVGTVSRIAAGVLIALAALPVVFTLLHSRKPEFSTPAPALKLRTWSVVAHVSAGVLIVGTAISEIWLSLDSMGQWLFGIYGAAAAVAVLGIAGFYLSFIAEMPPPPPKPPKPKRAKGLRRRRRKDDGGADSADAPETDGDAENDDAVDDTTASVESSEAATAVADAESTAQEAPAVEESDDTVTVDSGGLRNRRPSGKRSGSHRRRRSSRGIAVDE